MRLVIILGGELHGMCRHHRQVQAGGHLHAGGHMRFIVHAAGALDLQVEAVRKHRRQLQRDLTGALGVALHQRLADRAGLRDNTIRPSPSSLNHSGRRPAP